MWMRKLTVGILLVIEVTAIYIGKIRNLIDANTTHMLVHAFITSRLDYCNSLLVGIPNE